MGISVRTISRLFIMGICLFVGARAALACTCELPQPGKTLSQQVAEAREKSKAVFSGVALEVIENPQVFYVEVKFRVQRSWKLVNTDEITIRTGRGRGDCGYRFEIGESYLVYAYGSDESHLETNICQRTTRQADAGEELRLLGKGKTPGRNSDLQQAFAQGLCVHKELEVSLVSGRVIMQLEKGESPLPQASVALLDKGGAERVIAQTTVKADGGFGFTDIKPGKYTLRVTHPGLAAYYGGIHVTPPAKTADTPQPEIVVTIGADFLKPCGGSSAELREKTGGGSSAGLREKSGSDESLRAAPLSSVTLSGKDGPSVSDENNPETNVCQRTRKQTEDGEQSKLLSNGKPPGKKP
jgi:hypothetical protein